MKLTISYIKENRAIVISLLVIFFIGTFLRVFRIEDFMFWSDSSRDTIVAERLSRFDRVELLAPYSAGSGSLLFNSYLYYYYLAFLYLFAGNPISLSVLIAVINSLTIVVNFLIGKEMKNDWTGLIAAFFTALSYGLIEQSYSVVQPFILPFYISLFVLFILYSYKRYSYSYLFFSIVLFWFFYNIHYSVIALTPLFITWFILLAIRIFKKRRSYLKLFYLICAFFLLAFHWIIYTHSTINRNIFVFLFTSITKNSEADSLSGVTFVINRFIEQLFNYSPTILRTFVLLFFVLGFLFLIFGKYSKKKSYFYEVNIVLFFLSIVFISGFKGKVMDSYFVFFNTIFPIALAYLIVSITRKRYFWAFTFVTLFGYYLNFGNFRLHQPVPSYSYVRAQEVSEIIIEDIETDQLISFSDVFITTVADHNPLNWDSPRYWYFLEKHFQQDNLVLRSNFNNLQSSTLYPQVFYLVCESQYFESEQICIEKLPVEYKNLVFGDIVNLNQEDDDYSVFRINIIQELVEQMDWDKIYNLWRYSDIVMK